MIQQEKEDKLNNIQYYSGRKSFHQKFPLVNNFLLDLKEKLLCKQIFLSRLINLENDINSLNENLDSSMKLNFSSCIFELDPNRMSS